MRRSYVLEKGIVEDFDADGADADEPALWRQRDAQGVGSNSGHGQQRRCRSKHGIEDQGDRVGPDLLPNHVGDAEDSDCDDEKTSFDPAADGIVQRTCRIRPGHRHRAQLWPPVKRVNSACVSPQAR